MPVYYNEIDKDKAAWLRELIRENVVAPGQVDTRSIKDIAASDLAGFSQCHFFAGIGVWSYALRLAGWPDDRPVWTGSCPCPSFSAAGKGGGFNDPRHLWPDWSRLVGECKPAIIFGEQADDAIGYGWLDLVQTDLERANYAVGKAVLGACSVGAPHIRQRLYFLARRSDCEGGMAHAEHAERGSELQEYSDTHGQYGFGRRSHASNLADAADTRRQVAGEHRGRQPLVPARSEQHGDAGRLEHANFERCGEARSADSGRGPGGERASGYLADSDGRGFAMCGLQGEGQRDGEQCGANVGLGDADRTASNELSESLHRPQEESDHEWFGDGRERHGHRSASHVNGFWRDADWILRKRWNRDDWEWCPTEPGTFPLAHGSAARVLRLRGYGDAICAPLAAEFIKAFQSLI